MTRKNKQTEGERRLPVVLVVDGGGTVYGELLDISGRSVTIRCARKVEVGSQCGLLASLPYSPAAGQPRIFEATGRVRRATRAGRATLIELEMFDMKCDLAQWSGMGDAMLLAKEGAEHASLHAV